MRKNKRRKLRGNGKNDEWNGNCAINIKVSYILNQLTKKVVFYLLLGQVRNC